MTDPTPEPNAAALARYLSGESGPAEADAIRRWIEEDPERRRSLEELKAAWSAAAEQSGGWDLDAMWSRIAAQMARPPARSALQVEPQRDVAHRLEGPGSPLLRWGAIAATLVLVSGAAIWQLRHQPPAPMREVVTARGQRAELRFGDGSRVLLGVASRLRFPATFGRSRDVELEGEAYFDVQHDAARPFRVHAAGTITEDLGTQFVIRSYPTDTAVRVVVASGKVAVRRQDLPAEGLDLVRGELALVGSTGIPKVTQNVDVDAYLEWTSGRLEFHGAPLGDVVRELERWYAIEIVLSDSSIISVPFTGSFKNQSADEVLDAVARSLDLAYRRQGDTVRLVPKPARRN
jgi:transmembrane sensor